MFRGTSVGTELARDKEALAAILPDLVSKQGNRLFALGMGLCDGATDRYALWDRLRAHLEKTNEDKRNINVMLGFIAEAEKADPDFCTNTLDRLTNDPLLGPWFPLFQGAVKIDHRGIERLNECLDSGLARVEWFRRLAWARAHESISDQKLVELIKRIASVPGGDVVSLEILHMRFHGQEAEASQYELLAAGRDLLSRAELKKNYGWHDSRDYELSCIARQCLSSLRGVEVARDICRKIALGICEFELSSMDFPQLTKCLAELHPDTFLDEFLFVDQDDAEERARMILWGFHNRENPFNAIPDEDVIAWCEHDPATRYPEIAGAVECLSPGSDAQGDEWRPLFFDIVSAAPVLRPVLDRVAERLRPRSWSGSMADILQSRLGLFPPLFEHPNAEVSAWARRMHSTVGERASHERTLEEERRTSRDETFE